MLTKMIAAAAGLAFATAAAAEVVLIDDFSTAQIARDTSAGNGAIATSTSYMLGGNTFARTLRVDQIEHGSKDPFLKSEARIGFGSLKLSNDSRTNAVIELAYGIDSLVDDFGSANELALQILFTDIASHTPFTIRGYLNGALLGTQSFTGPGALSFDLPDLVASGNELRLVFTGATAFDAEVGPISLRVPEPGALGLLGLAVVAVALRRRRAA